MPNNWLIFDRIRAFLGGSGIHRHENLIQDEPSLDTLTDTNSGRNSIQSAIMQSIQLNYYRLDRYKNYDNMDEMGEISLALDMYADESCVINTETNSIVQVYGTNTRVKKEVQNLFNKSLMLDHKCRAICRYLCKYGDAPFRIKLSKDRKKVVGLKRLDVFNFTRIETSDGDLVAFHYIDAVKNESYFMHPWEVVHFRLDNLEEKFAPYGKSVIEGGRKAHKQLTLMESSAIIYRLCVTGETLVSTPNGDVEIVNIKPGDKVFSYNNLGTIIETNVVYQRCNGVQDVYKLEIEDGHILATSTHPFLVHNIHEDIIEYVDLADIMPGKHFAVTPNRNREYSYIKNVQYVGKRKVYDIEVDHPCHNFIANEMVIHNTRSPQKRKFKIPIGAMPSKKVPEYLRKIAAGFKNKKFFNSATGEFDERSVQLTQEDDIFLPVRSDGVGPDVENLAGSDNMGKIEDVEYFLKKMLAPTKIPPSRVGIGDKTSDGDGKPLSQTSSDFAKNIGWVQQVMAVGFTKVALVHLALNEFNKDELNSFWVSMSVNSAMEELYRIETWQTRINIMSDMKEIGWFPKEWIISKFTDLSPDEIEQMMMMGDSKSADAPELGGGGGGGMGGGGGDMFGGGDPFGGGGGGEDPFGDAEGGEGGDEDPFGGLDEGGDEGGDEGDDEGGDEGADLFEESADIANKIKKLETELINDSNMDRIRKVIDMARKDTTGSIAESLIESNELFGIPKSQSSKKNVKLLVEGFEAIEGHETEPKTLNFEYYEFDERFGQEMSEEALTEAINYTINKERRLFVEDRNNEIIGNKQDSGDIETEDLPG